MSPQIRMINDIAAQFQHQAPDAAAAAIAEHVRAFWDPRMREELLEAEPQALDPLALAATQLLKERLCPDITSATT